MHRRLRRTTSLMVVFALSLSMVLGWTPEVIASNGEVPTVTVKSASAAPGETVEIAVEISGNPGILGATFEISYASSMELISAKSGEAFSMLNFTRPGQFSSPCNFVWDGQELSQDEIKDGTILTMTFQISEEAVVGNALDVHISYDSRNVVDGNLNPVQVTTMDGTVTVSRKTTGERPVISSATGTMTDETISVSINSQTSCSEAALILAGYDDRGRFLGCSIKTISLKPGENIFEFQKKYEDAGYKTFLIDTNFSPCCPAIEFPKASNQDDGSPLISVSSVTVKPGDTEVEVNVRIQNNPGVLGMILSVAYDEDVLTLKSAANGDAVKDVLSLTKPGKFSSPCKFVWDGQEITEADTKDGVILTLKFDISASAAGGSYPITFTYNSGDIINNSFEAVDVAVQSGTITVTK